MEWYIDQNVFTNNFIKGKSFSHKTNIQFHLFPFTGNTSDQPVPSFDNILGAFLRCVYKDDIPQAIDRESILKNICENTTFSENSANESTFKQIIKARYFQNENILKNTTLKTYRYAPSTKNENKIAKYISDAICDTEIIENILEKVEETQKNVLDLLVQSHFPQITSNQQSKFSYKTIIPEIKALFTQDMKFLLENQNRHANDLIQLIEYYYFFYTSQVVFRLNHFFDDKADEVMPLFFCMEQERTSKSRSSYKRGWKLLNTRLNTMFSHATLLEMLNQNSLNEALEYREIRKFLSGSSSETRNRIFEQIDLMKSNYIHNYVPPNGFTYSTDSVRYGDVEGLIYSFFEAVLLQFKEDKDSRKRANDAYSKSFIEFCKYNFLQNRKANGMMLVLTEDRLVFLTKVVIGKNKQMRLNCLFSEFERRGVFMDATTREHVIAYYEKLNIIEKKSDSGDAQYVKGIL